MNQADVRTLMGALIQIISMDGVQAEQHIEVMRKRQEEIVQAVTSLAEQLNLGAKRGTADDQKAAAPGAEAGESGAVGEH